MHLQVIISRLSNLLFFAQKTDGDNLTKFDLRKYLIDGNVNRFFYGRKEDKIWREVEEIIGKKKAKKIKKSIALLDPIFASRWHETSKHLFLWKQYFQNNKLLLRQTILEVKRLIGIKHLTISKIPIYLVSNPCDEDKEIGARFSWTPKESFIVVEIPLNLKAPNDFFPLSVLAHEFFHLILRKNKNLFSKIGETTENNKKLFTKLSGGMPQKLFLEELLISSFVPEGYLSKKYFNTKITTCAAKPKSLLKWRKFIAFKLEKVAKAYVDNSWRIDEKYLKNLIRAIK